MFTHRIHPKLLLPWLALGLGLLASVSTAWLVRQGIQRDAVSQFAFSADQITIKVRERLESFELILRGGAGLFESSQQVDRQEWHHFVEKVAADEIVPGAQGIGFSLLVKPEQLANHIASVRAEGFPDYNIRPAGPRDIYTSIVYLEPFKDTNLLAFGYDMYAEPVRQAAMAHARDTGLATLSGKITLVQDTDANPKPGVLMYVPVYRAGLPAWNTEQRRAALLGWTYSPFRMQDMMHGILRGWESKEGRYVDLHIFDGSETTRDKQLYDSFVTEKPVPHTIFFQHREVYFYDHLWVLEFDRISSAPDIDYSYAWLTLAGGIAITLLLAGLLRSLNDTLVNARALPTTSPLKYSSVKPICWKPSVSARPAAGSWICRREKSSGPRQWKVFSASMLTGRKCHCQSSSVSSHRTAGSACRPCWRKHWKITGLTKSKSR